MERVGQYLLTTGHQRSLKTIASYEILQAVLLRAKSVLFHRHETPHLPHILNTSTSILFI